MSTSRTKNLMACAFITLMLAFMLAACGGSKETVQTETAPPETGPVEPPPQPEPTPEPPPPPPREEAPEPLVLGNVNFDFDSYELTAYARDILSGHAQAIKSRSGVGLVIAGHCDERGTIEYNLALGEKRANAVMSYLVSLGVERSRLTTISYGKERPLDSRSSEEAWAKNRRAEFVVQN